MSAQETSIKEISKFASRLERLNKEEQSRKHVSFPAQSSHDQSLDELRKDELRKEIALLRQQHKLQNEELKAMANSKLNTGTINAAHAQMHPTRQQMMSQAQQYNNYSGGRGRGKRRSIARPCFLWEKGPCSFGDKCIFQHNAPQGIFKKQK